MAKRIPLTIDAEIQHVDAAANLSCLVPAGTKSVVTGSGQIIPASNFSQYRAADVPEGFDTQAATINKAGGGAGLLEREVALINWWLSGFEKCPAGPRTAFANDTADFIGIANFPLPDGYVPDYIHLALYVSEYPSVAPIGIYLASKGSGGRVVAQIRSKLNVFQGKAFHGAERPLEGYEWVCLIAEDWRVNMADIRKGQNLQKYLSYFNAVLAQ